MSLRVQLNALFCCLWRNVEASSHKHFVVFSGNQHCHLLPATCHNLRHGGCGQPRTVLTTPARFRVNSTAVKKPDIGSESRFLPTPPAFDARLKGSRRSLAIVWHGKTRLVVTDRHTHTIVVVYVNMASTSRLFAGRKRENTITHVRVMSL